MHKWTDKHGAVHVVRIEYPAAIRLHREFGADCDLMDCYKRPQLIDPLFRFLTIDSNMVAALYVVENSGGDEEAFAECFADADTLRGAQIALLNAVTDFFPQEVRPALREELAMLEMVKAVENVQDCFTRAGTLATRGSGSNDCSDVSGTTATESPSGKSSSAITANDPTIGG